MLQTAGSLWIGVCHAGVQWFARHLTCEYSSNFLCLSGSNLNLHFLVVWLQKHGRDGTCGSPQHAWDCTAPEICVHSPGSKMGWLCLKGYSPPSPAIPPFFFGFVRVMLLHQLSCWYCSSSLHSLASPCAPWQCWVVVFALQLLHAVCARVHVCVCLRHPPLFPFEILSLTIPLCLDGKGLPCSDVVN